MAAASELNQDKWTVCSQKTRMAERTAKTKGHILVCKVWIAQLNQIIFKADLKPTYKQYLSTIFS